MGNQDCVGQLGRSTRPVALSLMIFCNTWCSRLKGGKDQNFSDVHCSVKASIANASGSGLQETNLEVWQFVLEANRSISIWKLSIWDIALKMEGFNCHSVSLWNVLDSLSAVMFSDPGIWAEDSHIFLPSAHLIMFFVMSLHCSEWVPPISLMYAMAVVLSTMILT